MAGRFWIQAVPSANGLVALDVSDPANPVEAARVTLDDDDWPHWISLSPDGRRIVVTGYAGTRHRVILVDLDPETGSMAVDEAFTSPGASTPRGPLRPAFVAARRLRPRRSARSRLLALIVSGRAAPPCP